jgi:LuxR family maltose regulon positive regulatory protein
MPPRATPYAVERSSLRQRISATDATLVRVTAPAGYGKSTLLAQWAATDHRPVGWCSVDSSDDDPVVLLTNLALVAESLGVIDDDQADRLIARDLPWDTVMLPELVDSFAACVSPFGLVLDDVHLLKGPSREIVLPVLASHIPEGAVCVLSSRVDSPIPVRRLQLAGQLMTLDASDLAFGDDEGAALFEAAGLVLDDDHVRRLVEHTEGWAAGLYIAALTLRDADDVAGASERFTGSNLLVAGYLGEEVLAVLPQDDVEFVLKTSVLQWMCGDLCDAVLERAGSGAVLARLAHENQFIVALDDNGEWYRYHHLFADSIRDELHRRDGAVVDRIAIAASRWFAEQHDLNGAVVHALAAHDRNYAASLIWRYAPPLLTSRHGATVEGWLDRYTPEQVAATPELSLTAAWLAVTQGDIAGMQRFTAAAELSSVVRLSDDVRLDAAVALVHSLAGIGRLAQLCEDAALAFDGHPSTHPFRALARMIEGKAWQLRGDDAQARVLLEEAITIGGALAPSVEAHALAHLARMAGAEGDWSEATRLVNRALEIVQTHSLMDRPLVAVDYAIAAVVHSQGGFTQRADEECQHGLDLLARVELPTSHFFTEVMLDLAIACARGGNLGMAHALVEDAGRRLARLPDTGILVRRLDEAKSLITELSSTEGAKLVVPLTPAELRVLQYLPTHLSFGNIGQELFVSRNTVKSQAISIYRKLGVASRREAVDEARAVGLLRD